MLIIHIINTIVKNDLTLSKNFPIPANGFSEANEFNGLKPIIYFIIFLNVANLRKLLVYCPAGTSCL
jgi:hypothetical protein